MKFLFIFLLSSLSFAAEFDWQGHRGARGLYPENTIGAMKEALKYPITTLELDVVISADQQVVVSHEPWMSDEICLDPKGVPVKGREVNLYKLTYEQIKQYDCGSKVHPRFPDQRKEKEVKPLLSVLIQEMEKEMLARNLVKKYSIEIKSLPEDERDGFQPDYKKFTDLVMEQILKQLKPERFMIQSFDWRVLKYLHQKWPTISQVALRETPYTAKGVLKELGLVPTVFSPDYTMLTEKDITFFHKKGIKVVPWTVNKLDDMHKLIKMGVDGIITDYPNLINNLTEKKSDFRPDCFEGENRFEGKCIKVPAHAVASPNIPGWVCKKGYVQKRDSCFKIKLPKHAVFMDDGKTWVCQKGFKRYRGKCQKM